MRDASCRLSAAKILEHPWLKTMASVTKELKTVTLNTPSTIKRLKYAKFYLINNVNNNL